MIDYHEFRRNLDRRMNRSGVPDEEYFQAMPGVDPMPPQSQKQAILQHLERIGPITPLEALELYGCFRLAARIQELKQAGHAINSRQVTNRHGVKFAEYSLAGGAQ